MGCCGGGYLSFAINFKGEKKAFRWRAVAQEDLNALEEQRSSFQKECHALLGGLSSHEYSVFHSDETQLVFDPPEAFQLRSGEYTIVAEEKMQSVGGGAWKRVQGVLLKRNVDLFPNASPLEGKVPMWKSVSYAAPELAKMSMQRLITVHILVHYEKLGASLALLAFFQAIGRSLDVLTDPLMANITDGAETPYGRRRPFMLVGTFLYGAFLFLLCNPPTAVTGKPEVSYWFGAFYILFFMADTLTHIPFNALGQELTSDPKERRGVFFIVKIFEGLGSLIASVSPVLLGLLMDRCDLSACTNAPDTKLCEARQLLQCQAHTQKGAFLVIGGFFALWHITTMLHCVWAIRENASKRRRQSSLIGIRSAGDAEAGAVAATGAEAPKLTKIETIVRAMGNAPFRVLVLAWILDVTVANMAATMLPFFIQFVTAPEEFCYESNLDLAHWTCSTPCWLGVAVCLFLVAAIVAAPMWLTLAKQIGDYKAWLAFNCVNAITNGLFVFCGKGDMALSAVFCLFNGIPLGASFLTTNLRGLIIDYDEVRTGERTEASFCMFASFVPKVVAVPATALPISMLAASG
ncbi:unnamed protein product [Vitrella brassicaformis CCMP3155]|uniref:Uncharacterized protein n=1 Tax=Vitrella brassicaformis (strain CCMP3155) TaxID=1169540 RepID=A0A0G4FDP8_VITBC|nr:unnamed protein product [Vitrella brassicaformis CCMP3155]|eukprot:CEM11315.1 unnamed protein product [Vitrella brassicaformis CCMP3155]